MSSVPVRQRDTHRTPTGAPMDPPPPYSEAAAWSPDVQPVSSSSAAHRPHRPTTVHSEGAPKLRPRHAAVTPAQRPASAQESPLRSNTQYDGLTGRRTRRVPSPRRPLPTIDLFPRAGTSTSYDGLTRQHYSPRPRVTTAPNSTNDTITSSLPSAPATRASSSSAQPRSRGRDHADGPVASLAREPGHSRTRRPSPPPAAPSFEASSTSAPASRTGRGTPRSTQDGGSRRPPRSDGPTDLDILLARIELASEPEYNDLTLLADLLGPARTLPTIDALNIPEGTVELLRRRVTRDGRVKLKLQLLGASVERCSACLAQFRESDKAAVMQPCAHPVHADCARKWLACSTTCPMCRHDLRPASL
ncbi:hypothetical protein AURDEDRAFT_115975 [Auricularia subglabra TFB-10046 SS5]|uniref:RING-type domain-containing protein n=1 Tax=Auricularia subglabra (strain TFB-10046 / SS5) TaxID=717982 RepID=J0D243_AURST|nr:hypothetical protein AURDEDRAFT_115975 [Auricularia subglabra TFB-10046 SS5]